MIQRILADHSILLQAYYTQASGLIHSQDKLPLNVVSCALPNPELSYEEEIAEARSLFLKLYPDKSFFENAESKPEYDSD